MRLRHLIVPALSLALCACAGRPSKPAVLPAPVASAPVASPRPQLSASRPAMMPTSASAAEFVRGYYRVLNAAATSGDDSGLAGLTVSPSCSYCHDQLRDLTDFARHHQHTSGPAWVIRSVQAYPVVARASTVTVTIEAPAIRLLDANGVVVDTLPYRPTYAVSVEATWTGRGWGVTNIVEFA